MSRSRPSCCLSLVTSATTSPRTMVELVHSAVSSFDENTYFCMALILSAHGWVLPGQIFAKLSYVFRPINIASHASSWPNPSRRYASSRYSKNPEMPAPVKTPSTETRVYSIIFRIRWCPFPLLLSRENAGKKCRDLTYCLCIVPLNWKPGSTLTQCSCVLSFDRLNRRFRVPPPTEAGGLTFFFPPPVCGAEN